MKRIQAFFMRPFRASRTAMTLMEMLILVACISIVMMLVLPMATTSDDTKVRSAARIMIADIQLAQLQSMGNGSSPRVLVFHPTMTRYHIANAHAPAVPIHNRSTNAPYETTFGRDRAHALDGVRISSLSVGGDNQLGFTPLGALDQAAAATITLAAGDSSITITINATTGEAVVE